MSIAMSAGRSWLRLALRRVVDEPALLAASAVVALVAVTAAAACVVYPDTVARRGLLATLAAADPARSAVVVEVDAAPEDADRFATIVDGALRGALGPGAGRVVATARSASWELPGGSGPYPPLSTLAWDEGLPNRTTLVAGSWPLAGASDVVEVVVTAGAAEALGVAPGAAFEIASRRDPAVRLRVVVRGIVAITDPADPAWGADRLVLDGAAQPGSFPLRGPLFVARDVLLARAGGGGVTLTWRALPAFEGIAPDDVARIRGAIGGLEARLERDLGTGAPVTVATDLGELLGAAGAGVTAGRAGVAIVAVQLLVLAGYALVLIAALVLEARRAATELAVARGARPAGVVGLAAIEGLLVALPAVVLGPGLAILLVGALAGADPGAAAGGGTAPGPRLTPDAIVLALIAGLVVMAAMALPTAARLGPVARLRGRLGGRGAPSLGERTGIDVALLVLASLALWQLRERGAAVTGWAGGDARIDPLVAAAPALGLLAGGLLALRVGPLVGAWAERPAGAARGAVATLAGRGVARRSAEAGRAALLLVVATALVLFAAAYGRTWTRSQAEQVAAAVPAALVAAVPPGPAARPDWVTRDALLALPGVAEAAPVVRETFAVGSVVRAGVLVAVPAEVAASLAGGQPTAGSLDAAGRPFADVVRALAGDRPALPGIAIPDGATSLGLLIDAGLTAAASADGVVRPIPAGWAGLSTAVVVRDGTGVLHRLAGAVGAVAGGRQELIVTLTAPLGEAVAGTRPAAAGPAAFLAPPTAIVAVELAIALPDGVAATGRVRLDGVTATVPGGWTAAPLDLGPTAGWVPVRSSFGVPPAPLPPDSDGAADRRTLQLDEPVVGPEPVVLALRWAAPPMTAGLPGILDRGAADALGLAAGDTVPIVRGATDVVLVRVVGIVDLVPGIAPGPGGLLVDLPALDAEDYARWGTLPAPTEWWAGPEPGATLEAAVEGVTALGLDEVRVRSALLEGRLRDPLARGVLGALELVAGAALAIAVVGFAIVTWRAIRARRTDLAVARALGMGRGQSAAWVALELAFQVALGIGGGILLGLALAWAVLPSATMTPDGSPPVPAPVVALPWDLAGAALVAGLAGYLLLLVPLRRSAASADLAGPLRDGFP